MGVGAVLGAQLDQCSTHHFPARPDCEADASEDGRVWFSFQREALQSCSYGGPSVRTWGWQWWGQGLGWGESVL